MTRLARLRSFLRAALFRSRMDRDLREEWQFHIDRRAADLAAGGLAPAEARARAEREFGGTLALREASRDARGQQLADELGQDLRFALRLMRKAPGFTLAALLSLSLGIGANTAIFSLVDAVLIRTIPVVDPQTLYYLAHGDGDRPSTSSNYPLYEAYARETTGVFTAMTAYAQDSFMVAGREGPERVIGQFAAGNYHHVLGVPIVLGRGFVAQSDYDTTFAAAVISEAYWTRRFGRSADAIHQTLQINGRVVPIIGVTGGGFSGLVPGTAMDITLPLSMRVLDQPTYLTMHDTWTGMAMVARLKEGASRAAALAVADAVFQRYMAEPENAWPRKDFPSLYTSARLLEAGRGAGGLRREYRASLAVLMTMVGLVLLLASVNIASLLSARGSARTREMAIRLCVGGGRGRLIRQLLTESLLLAGLGGAFGVLLSIWGVAGLLAILGGGEQPLQIDAPLNARVLAFTVTVSTLAGVTFGLWPAWSATRVDLIPALRVTNGAPTGGWRRIRAGRALVAAQVALAVLVVAVAALLGRTLHNLRAAPAGFDPAAVTLFIADAERANLPAVRLSAFQTELLQRVRALPGVVAASESWTSPLNTRGNGRAILRPDLPQTFESLGVFTNVVTPDYFPTIGIRLLHGRLLSDADTGQSRPVAVVNATMATFFFGDSNAVGRTFRFRSQADRDIHVVGVVQDVAQYNLRDPFLKMAFVPQSQGLEPMRHITVAVRMAGGAVLDAAVVRRIVRELNPDVMVRHLRTMHQDVDESLKRERMLAGLSGGFAAVALLLAAVGLYGVVSFDVARRRRDIGVRMALGASRTRVLSQVMRQTVATSMAGVAAGLVLAWAGTRATAALLWGLSPRDPLALGLAALILFTIACAAGYLPARRAANLDPMAVLRSE